MSLKKISSTTTDRVIAGRLSRRRFLSLAGTGIIVGTLAQVRRAEAKTSQRAARYQDTPKGDKSCSGCKLFLADENACRVVEGVISPNGYCRFWVRS
jgi:secreted PhoX family phosphatase